MAPTRKVTEESFLDQSDESAPNATESSRQQAGFQALNPAFLTALAVFILATIVSSGWTLFPLLPLGESGKATIYDAYQEDTYALVFVPLFLILSSWLVAGFAAQRRWLRILASVVAFVATAFFCGLVFFSAFAAGMRH